MAQILIVDDDAQLRTSFEKLLTQEGHQVQTAASGEAGLEKVEKNVPDLVVMDVRMPGMSGLETLKAMQQLAPKLPVVIMTAYGSTDTAIEATKSGAYDYLLKPFDIPEILKLINQALEASRLTKGRVKMDASPESTSDDALLGQSQVMQEVYKAIGRVAPTDATVLIRGESGTGKELVARAVYQHSLRANKPFQVINCVAIPETLLESELFGYEKGAFTGAASRRIGKIEQAHSGTVFLDEIGDMPVAIQAKLLRLLQEKKIERLGGKDPIPLDVRILAATNRDLEAAVAEGRFREDLYYRLKVVTLSLPPLRDRLEDIAILSSYFLNRFAADLGKDNPGLTKDALQALSRYQWPGNVRELANVLQKVLIFNRGGPVSEQEIAVAMGASDGEEGRCETGEEALVRWIRSALKRHMGEQTVEGLLDDIERIIIREALNMTGGNRTHAARLLGMSRPTLLSRIEKYNISISTSAT